MARQYKSILPASLRACMAPTRAAASASSLAVSSGGHSLSTTARTSAHLSAPSMASKAAGSISSRTWRALPTILSTVAFQCVAAAATILGTMRGTMWAWWCRSSDTTPSALKSSSARCATRKFLSPSTHCMMRSTTRSRSSGSARASGRQWSSSSSSSCSSSTSLLLLLADTGGQYDTSCRSRAPAQPGSASRKETSTRERGRWMSDRRGVTSSIMPLLLCSGTTASHSSPMCPRGGLRSPLTAPASISRAAAAPTSEILALRTPPSSACSRAPSWSLGTCEHRATAEATESPSLRRTHALAPGHRR
mmetsp:Transcript_44869/g.112531  ORF Transcript_44869/g.112531 Transcript_44869/m.112531 type:complete len:307 (-) Transcript_44869:51-971(-)